ncbi:MAG: hypothetical protein AAB215_08120 [Planctomycetota bacterium]
MTYREVVRWLRALPREKAPEGFARRVMETVESSARALRVVPNAFRAILAAAAAFALCAGAALWLSAPRPAEPPPVAMLHENLERTDSDKSKENAIEKPLAWDALSGERETKNPSLQEKAPDAIARLAPAAPAPSAFAAPAGAPAPDAALNLQRTGDAGKAVALAVQGDRKGAGGGAFAADGIPVWTLRAPRTLAGRPARTTEALASIAKSRGGAVDRARGAYLVEIPPDSLPDFRRALAARGFVFALTEDAQDIKGNPESENLEGADGGDSPDRNAEAPARIRIRISR